jgi:HPr kinase/phosphorylase
MSTPAPTPDDDEPLPAAVLASALVVGETGILVRGRSGTGKSSLVMALLDAAARRNLFARLVADDRVCLHVAGDRLLATPHPAIAGLIEERGTGILARPHEASVRISYVIDIVQPDRAANQPPRMPEPADLTTRIDNISLRRLILPANLPSETAARRILGLFIDG